MSGHRQARRVALGVAVAVVAAALVHPAASHAADTCTISWRGGSGSWADPTHWSPARVPAADDSVCVVRAAGAAPVSVRIPESTTVFAATLRSATLTVPTGVDLEVSAGVVGRAVLTGGGTLRNSVGTIEIRDSRLAGVHVATGGGLRLGGQVTFTGGTTIDGSGFTDLQDGVRIVDGDGNAANHIGLSNFPLYLMGSVFVGVRLGLQNVTLLSQQGHVRLAALDNLDADGRLTAPARTTLQLGVTTGGSLTLPRTVTTIGSRVDVFGGELTTPAGADALSALGEIDGALSIGRRLVTGRSLLVRGTLDANAPLAVPSIAVRAGARFEGNRVEGALTCAGTCLVEGAHLGRLTLQPTATTTVDLEHPLVVDGTAKLGGQLLVGMPFSGGPKPGVTLVLITAAKGVTGTFSSVVATRSKRSVSLDYRPTYVTGTLAATA